MVMSELFIEKLSFREKYKFLLQNTDKYCNYKNDFHDIFLSILEVYLQSWLHTSYDFTPNVDLTIFIPHKRGERFPTYCKLTYDQFPMSKKWIVSILDFFSQPNIVLMDLEDITSWVIICPYVSLWNSPKLYLFCKKY